VMTRPTRVRGRGHVRDQAPVRRAGVLEPYAGVGERSAAVRVQGVVEVVRGCRGRVLDDRVGKAVIGVAPATASFATRADVETANAGSNEMANTAETTNRHILIRSGPLRGRLPLTATSARRGPSGQAHTGGGHRRASAAAQAWPDHLGDRPSLGSRPPDRPGLPVRGPPPRGASQQRRAVVRLFALHLTARFAEVGYPWDRGGFLRRFRADCQAPSGMPTGWGWAVVEDADAGSGVRVGWSSSSAPSP